MLAEAFDSCGTSPKYVMLINVNSLDSFPDCDNRVPQSTYFGDFSALFAAPEGIFRAKFSYRRPAPHQDRLARRDGVDILGRRRLREQRRSGLSPI